MAEQLHPMEHIKVRPMRFDFDGVSDGDPIWSRSCPDFAMYINALAIHSPYFERFLGVVSRKAREQIEDPRLHGDIGRLIGQEAHHAYNFIAMNRFLAKRYPRVAEFDSAARKYFEEALRSFSFRRQLGFVAGYETFTYLAGMIVLDECERLMGDADPTVRALWVWHQVEEVEHGSVAFDMYRAVFGEHEWFRKRMLVEAFWLIARQTTKAYLHMCRVEGYGRRPVRAWRAAKFALSLTARLIAKALPALRAGYHPRNHPMCNERQNPIAVAWRRRYDGPETTATLDNRVIAEMMKPWTAPS